MRISCRSAGEGQNLPPALYLSAQTAARCIKIYGKGSAALPAPSLMAPLGPTSAIIINWSSNGPTGFVQQPLTGHK